MNRRKLIILLFVILAFLECSRYKIFINDSDYPIKIFRLVETKDPLLENEKIKIVFFKAVEEGDIKIPYSKNEEVEKKLGLSNETHGHREIVNAVTQYCIEHNIEKDDNFYEADGDPFFPWDDVLACKNFPFEGAYFGREFDLRIYRHTCLTPMFWLYFSSPSYTWEGLCGRAGKMLICPRCVQQVHFDLQIMN